MSSSQLRQHLNGVLAFFGLGDPSDNIVNDLQRLVEVDLDDQREIFIRLAKFMFTYYDSDNSGSIDKEELKALVDEYSTAVGKENWITDEKLQVIFSTADTDGDGQITWEEFLNWFTNFCLEDYE
eukprot:TRINITY_DN1907_c0_g1_i2.p1 TRINITY_DN1907_c0_g1~~TRINITY_DN1907_c0_g1_i2.p1  ORF type:complete len:125 (-),score=37.40 TRINITY_DN1907_c0_g1_i2:14-388(-)